MDTTLEINWLQLGLFSLILLLPLALNAWLRLELAKETCLAIFRMTVQLVLVGLYLKLLFELNHLWLNLSWILLMLIVGSSAILSKAKLPKRALFGPVGLGLTIGALPVLALMLLALLQPTPWYHTQYIIPLAGMLLGNCLSGNIVALRRLFDTFDEKSADYEGALCLGATPQQACFPFVQQAIRQAMAPCLASMTTAGVVTLPGMMTGQILAGTDPLLAIQYQLMIMLAIFVTLITSIAMSLSLAVRLRLTPSGALQLS